MQPRWLNAEGYVQRGRAPGADVLMEKTVGEEPCLATVDLEESFGALRHPDVWPSLVGRVGIRVAAAMLRPPDVSPDGLGGSACAGRARARVGKEPPKALATWS